MRVAILGAGSLGSVIGAFMSRAGNDVILIGRPAHVEKIKEDGLRVTGLEEFTARPKATSAPEDVDGADLLLLTTKTFDSEAALADVSFDVGVAVSLQNGVTKDDVLARKLGKDRVLGALTGIGASMIGPGVVAYTYNGSTVLGEMDGSLSKRLQKVVALFNESGLPAEASERILDDEWSKLCQYCAASMISALSRLEYHRMCNSRPLAELFVTISREVEVVARALGHELRDVASFRVEEVLVPPFEEAVMNVMERGRALERAGMTSVKISMLQDLEASRRTELEDTVDFVLQEARRLGINTPVLALAHQVVRGVEEAR